MSDTDIINGNKSIAAMLGWHYVPWTEVKEASALLGIPVHSGGWYKPKNDFVKELRFKGRTHYDLGFHKDWNRLMEAIDFVEKYGYQVDFGSRLLPMGDGKDTFCTVWDDAHTIKVVETCEMKKIDAVFKALWTFAILYNNKEV